MSSERALARVRMVLPGASEVRNGLQVTSERWRLLLIDIGHEVFIDTGETSASTKQEVIIAFNAYKCADRILELLAKSDSRLIVCLTGTDIYRDLPKDPGRYRIFEFADRLVVLHPFAFQAVPPKYRGKVTEIIQSAQIMEIPRLQDSNYFDFLRYS